MLTSRFAEGDMQGVIDVILPIQREEFEIPITAADQPDLRDIPGFYQVGKGDFWVAKVSCTGVGTIGLKDMDEGQAAIPKMFVVNEWRGREFGVAAALLQGLLAAAKCRAICEVPGYDCEISRGTPIL